MSGSVEPHSSQAISDISSSTVINNCDGQQVNGDLSREVQEKGDKDDGHHQVTVELLQESSRLKAQALQQQQDVVSQSDSKTLVDVDDLEEADGRENFLQQYPEIDVFIMSEAGKPIYCYSEREDLTTLMGVCVALLNFIHKTQNDHLRSIHTRHGLHINFAHRSPLVIVVVCRQHSCFDEQTLINQINAQIISTITLKSLKSVFQQAPTYDLKRLIHSTILFKLSNSIL